VPIRLRDLIGPSFIEIVRLSSQLEWFYHLLRKRLFFLHSITVAIMIAQNQHGCSSLIYETGEPTGQYGELKLVRVPAVGVVYGIDIVIPEEEKNIEIPHDQIISSIKPQKTYTAGRREL
jgi:hypothetical protein